MESLAHLEVLCERLYNSQDFHERTHSETALQCFSTNPDFVAQCLYVLDNASSSYALMMAATSLFKQLALHNLSLQLRLDIRNYVLSYLATRGEKLEPFVIGSLIKLLSRLTKFGWFDDDKFRDLVNDTMNFFNQGPCYYAIGLMILNQIVLDMNQAHPILPVAKQRRIAGVFKERSLRNIFQISLSSLHQFKNDVGSKLQALAISLSLSCLSFDFLGTSFDETSDEIGTVQIPDSWKQIIKDPSTVQIFFDYYAIAQSQVSKEALECLLFLTSVRRSLFPNDSSRGEFLSSIMLGTKEILQTGRGLSDHDIYHLFCRLLAQFKTNYQLVELINVDGYYDWIRLIAEFTVKSLHSWQWASSSVYFVLGLWSRLVASVAYRKDDKPDMLATYVPTIVESFISTRFDSLKPEFSDELSEDPLDNVELLQDQLDFFPYLCRFQEWTNLQPCDNKELSLIESKLAWMVHIIAAIVKTKLFSGLNGELQELLDSKLSACIFQLINVTDNGAHQQRYNAKSKQRLDRAILTFFLHFKKSYIGDQAMYSSKLLLDQLSKLVGLCDHLQVLNAIVGKLATNLKSYTKCKEVIDHTLSIFQEMRSGYMTGKMLTKLDAINFIISNPNKEHFPFLGEHMCSRSRTTFYNIIGLLIFMDETSLLKFKSSMDSLLQVSIILGSTPDAIFQSDAVKYALIGLTRDLRGIAMATNSNKSYGVLFDWLYPSQFNLLLKGVSYWFEVSEVTTPVLKLVAELVLNKSKRANFNSSSANGILLFREVSKLIVTYGSRIIPLSKKADMYTSKYKGILLCLTILTRALSGNYINFGVFELYGDRALADALDVALKMILSIPLDEVLAYPKLAVAYFAYLEELFKSHLTFVTSLDSGTFLYIVGSLDSGLKGLNGNISSMAAFAIDKLATFFFNNVKMGESATLPAARNLAQRITDCPALFPQILKTLCELVTFEDCSNIWSLTRPMLGLILINEEMFTNIKAQILASQPSDQQHRVSVFFIKIMVDVNQSLETTNRDKFSQNVNKMKDELRSL